MPFLIRPRQRALTALVAPGEPIIPRRSLQDFTPVTIDFVWFQQGGSMRSVEFTFSIDPPAPAVVELLILGNYSATEIPATPLTINSVAQTASDTFRLEFPPGISPGAFVRLVFSPPAGESGPFGFNTITEASP